MAKFLVYRWVQDEFRRLQFDGFRVALGMGRGWKFAICHAYFACFWHLIARIFGCTSTSHPPTPTTLFVPLPLSLSLFHLLCRNFQLKFMNRTLNGSQRQLPAVISAPLSLGVHKLWKCTSAQRRGDREGDRGWVGCANIAASNICCCYCALLNA